MSHQHLVTLLRHARPPSRLNAGLTVMAASSCLWFTMQNFSTYCDDTKDVENVADEVLEPYPNIPEVDEETNCSFCLMSLQGPCRDLFRNWYYCNKDHGTEAKDKYVAICGKYARSFWACSVQYKNLYWLISKKISQEQVVDPMFKELEETALPMPSPEFNWSQLIDYYNDTSTTLNDIQRNKGAPKEPKEDLHPVLVDVLLDLSDDANSQLYCAYIKDETGTLLGHKFIIEEEEEEEEEDGKGEEKNENKEDKEEGNGFFGFLGQRFRKKEEERKDEDIKDVSSDSEVEEQEQGESFLEFVVQPNKTRSVTLYKVFEKEKNNEDGSTTKTHVMYKTESISLVDIAKYGGIPSKPWSLFG